MSRTTGVATALSDVKVVKSELEQIFCSFKANQHGWVSA